MAFKVVHNIIFTFIIQHIENTAQLWLWSTEYLPSVVIRFPVIYVISSVREKYGKIKTLSGLPAIELCFVINVLKNKTVSLLKSAGYCTI